MQDQIENPWHAHEQTMPDLRDRYRFVARLASGGMADVFLGVQKGAAGFERLVVIKRIHAAFLGSEVARQMFIDEARLVASLSHPHIVKIFDVGRLGRDVCFAMEYVSGENLDYIRSVLQKSEQQLPLSIACRLIIQACEALHYAHSANDRDGNPLRMIHRDISPHNLILDHHGYIKVIDFGVAHSEAGSGGGTAAGMVRGKYSYMAPDLFLFNNIDHRIDIYALGLVLHELCTSQKVFNFNSSSRLAEVYRGVLQQEVPPPSKIVPGLPEGLDAICARAIHRDRERRFQTADELGHAVRELAKSFGGLPSTLETAAWYKQMFATRIERRLELEQRVFDKFRELESRSLRRDPNPIRPASENLSALTQERIDSVSLSQLSRPRRFLLPLLVALLACTTFALAFFLTADWQSESPPKKSPSTPMELPENLLVLSKPVGAEVFLDDKFFGRTAAQGVGVHLEVGKTHRLRVRKPGFEEYVAEVIGLADGRRRIEADLSPIPQELEGLDLSGPALPRAGQALKQNTASGASQPARPPKTSPENAAPPPEPRTEETTVDNP